MANKALDESILVGLKHNLDMLASYIDGIENTAVDEASWGMSLLSDYDIDLEIAELQQETIELREVMHEFQKQDRQCAMNQRVKESVSNNVNRRVLATNVDMIEFQKMFTVLFSQMRKNGEELNSVKIDVSSLQNIFSSMVSEQREAILASIEQLKPGNNEVAIDILKIKQELEETQKNLRAYQVELEGTQILLRDSLAEKEVLQNKLVDYGAKQEQLKALEAILSDKEQEVKIAQNGLAESREQWDSTKKALNECQVVVENLKKELARVNCEASESNTELLQAKKEISKLKEDLANARRDANNSFSRFSDMQQEYLILEKNMADLGKEKKFYREVTKGVRRRLIDKRSELQEAVHSIQIGESVLNDFRNLIGRRAIDSTSYEALQKIYIAACTTTKICWELNKYLMEACQAYDAANS